MISISFIIIKPTVIFTNLIIPKIKIYFFKSISQIRRRRLISFRTKIPTSSFCIPTFSPVSIFTTTLNFPNMVI